MSSGKMGRGKSQTLKVGKRRNQTGLREVGAELEGS